MAEIKTFTADVSPNNVIPYGERRRREPSLGLMEAGAQIERAGTTLAHTIAADRDYKTQQDVQGSYKDAAIFRQQALEKLDTMRQSGKPVSDDFNEYLMQTASDLRQNRTTEHGIMAWDTHAAGIMSDMGHNARIIDSDIAGQNAAQDAAARVNANGLSLQKDPTQLPSILAENAASIAQLNIPAQLKGKILDHMNTEAARNATEGYIDANPYRAKEILADTNHIANVTLTPELRTHLMDRADTKIRGIEAQQMKTQADNERQWTLQNQKVMVDSIVQMHQGKLSGDGIAKLAAQVDPKTGKPVIDAAQVDHMFNYLEREAKEGQAKDDNLTVAQWAPKIYDNSASVDDVQRLAYNRQISTGTAERWIRDVQQGTTAVKQARAGAAAAAGLKFGVTKGFEWVASPEARTAYAQYTNWLHEQEDALRKAGKPATDFYMSGEAQAGIAHFMPANPQSLGQQTGAALESHVPVQFPDGTWAIKDPTAKKGAGGPADGWRTVGAGGKSFSESTSPAQHAAPGMADALTAEIKAKTAQVGSMKPGPARDLQIQLLQETKLRLQNLPK